MTDETTYTITLGRFEQVVIAVALRKLSESGWAGGPMPDVVPSSRADFLDALRERIGLLKRGEATEPGR